MRFDIRDDAPLTEVVECLRAVEGAAARNFLLVRHLNAV